MHIPIETILKNTYRNEEKAKAMRYRHDYQASEKIADFFDGEIYKKIRSNFTDERDVALSFSTDGFRPYKTKKTEKDYTAPDLWPLIFINLNLPPDERIKFENIIIAGALSFLFFFFFFFLIFFLFFFFLNIH